ncbi:hypothetical protein CC80DRAFT_562388 [Byssothecium circinans]|uniref:Peptidase M43 pregnancy-associated plasma-A domain-containing protein n=1 Tax=Byssothecium circinans TaxID=147558 RepID=A0A6A5TYP2_9PLEO|nr:hypothetical protein CC80DRAFT_562388 [Byssothecium circinans]
MKGLGVLAALLGVSFAATIPHHKQTSSVSETRDFKYDTSFYGCASKPSEAFVKANQAIAIASAATEENIPEDFVEIDLVIHVWAASERPDDGFEQLMLRQVSALNDAFKPAKFRFRPLGYTRGIDANLSTKGTIADRGKHEDAGRYGGYNILNLYIVRDPPPGAGGVCTFPQDEPALDLSDDGCMVGAGTLNDPPAGAGFSGGMTAVHEVGHWLGLRHTFQEADESGLADCNHGTGDDVADTPVHLLPKDPDDCSETTNSCPGFAGNDPVRNYMNYMGARCQSEFTKGQITRMHNWWKARSIIMKRRRTAHKDASGASAVTPRSVALTPIPQPHSNGDDDSLNTILPRDSADSDNKKVPYCGFKADEASVASNKALAQQERKQSQKAMSQSGTTEIDVYMHMIVPELPTNGWINDEYARLRRQIDLLNEGYKSTGLHFNPVYADVYVSAEWSYLKKETPVSAYGSQLHNGSYTTLNMYFVRRIYDNIAGLVKSLPQHPPADWIYTDGVTIAADTMETRFPVIIHETGHWLGLHHTFQEGFAAGETPSCEGGYGDDVDDTPTHLRTPSNVDERCKPTDEPLDTCPNQEGKDPVHNFMNFMATMCLNEFTNGQIQRMHSWCGIRKGLDLVVYTG